MRSAWRLARATLPAVLGLVACSGEARIQLLAPEPRAAPDGGVVGPGSDAGAVERDIDVLRRSACARFVTSAERGQGLLMMVTDVSTAQYSPRGASSPVWAIEQPILQDFVSSLPASVGLGVLLYPTATTVADQPRGTAGCVDAQALIPVNLLGAEGSRQRQRLLLSLAQAEPVALVGSPTLDAYLVALSALGRTTLAGSRQLLLITDGQVSASETCSTGQGMDGATTTGDTGAILEAIGAAQRAGVKTYVVGLPSAAGDRGLSDTRGWLSLAAEAGGTAAAGCSHTGPTYCHFDLASGTDLGPGLTGALSDIARRLGTCEYALPDSAEGDLLASLSLEVVLSTNGGADERLLRQDTAAGCVDGWQYADPQHLRLCSDTCAALQADADSELELLFGCPDGAP